MKTFKICIFLLATLVFTASAVSAEVFFYDTDNVGTPVAMWDSKGNKVWEGEYYPFGQEYRSQNIKTSNKNRFIGKERDKETGLTYFGARYFDERSGRFLTPDPVRPVDPFTSKTNYELLANPQRLNRYAYGLNNPYKFVDPDGRDAIYIHYDGYPIKTPIGTLPLGHGAVVAVDPEFGRYDGNVKGKVKGPSERVIPNVDIGKNGLPTEKSLKNLYDYMSKTYGKGHKVSADYHEDSDYKGTIEFAENFKEKHSPYKPISNNCKTFAKDAATAKKEKRKND